MSAQTEEAKFVAFKLNNEFYALDVHQVTEVFTPSSITEIPQAPAHTAGVINYRGEIVTVVDLKKRLSIKQQKIASEYDTLLDDEESRLYVIIVKSGSSVVGLLVDYVEAVIGIQEDKIRSAIDLISGKEQTSFLKGVARTDYGLTVLLSLDMILSEYDILDSATLQQLRDKMADETDSGEVVIDSGSIVDLDDHDDIDEYADDETPEFTKIDDDGATGFGDSPLDLDSLTKSELLKIAIEMNISDVTTRSTKNEIIDKINKQLGN
ncbi:MAG: chemotaxis protein CheW [Candidatus Heimdallarchaeota archaeon]|nr:chemotaxis protein CheW [Candidatus Heimdallarchaeota archaeon]